MIKSKYINIVVAIATALALIFGIAIIVIANVQSAEGTLIAGEPQYATKIFGEDIISIDIIADEDDWQQMLDNATAEEYIVVDVVVNGTKFTNVGIRPKGNSSLSQVASSDSDRYSFRLQFDEYVKGQTCFGLQSFVVNNMLGDSTYMKEYTSYDIMRTAGVDCPYFGFSNLTLNGEPWGLYLAVELYNDSYQARVYGDSSGTLYNVKSMDMGQKDDNTNGMQGMTRPDNAGDRQSFIPPGDTTLPDDFTPPDGMKSATVGGSDSQPGQGDAAGAGKRGKRPEGMPTPGASGTENMPQPAAPGSSDTTGAGRHDFGGGGKGGMGGGSKGGDLKYTDDSVSSYGAIFNNVVGKENEASEKNVIAALKALSEGENLEEYFDVDKILRYLAAHTVVVNLDSYSSSMAQNYYICDRDGVMSILPWDYNLTWGGFQSGSASSVVNFPIDTPLSGLEMSDRPLVEKLFENEDYLTRYHTYLQDILDKYFANGAFEVKLQKLNKLISEYVKNDKTAFYTYDQYTTGVAAFTKLGNLRAESIQGQLNGTVPSTTAGQSQNPSALIDASAVALTDLGTNGVGGARGGNGGKQKTQ